ncbi:PfkB family carbohydrate kinase [Megalodesulfovibrio paquesii]
MPDTSGKILPLTALAERLQTLRAQGHPQESPTVVHCHGVFDLLHIGHIRHFQAAKRLGDLLVVTVTPDEFVNKGPHRPVFTAALRTESIAALDCVDYVAVNAWPTAVEALALLKPDIYVKGSEYKDIDNDPTGRIVDEAQAVARHGGRIEFTEDVVFSSSTLLNDFFSPFPEPVQQYVRDISRRLGAPALLGWLERAAGLRAMVVGETILDEYVLCDTLGKSGKEPILAARHVEAECHAGGVLAIANHLAAFARRVDLVSSLGEQEPQEEFVLRGLRPGVVPHLARHAGPTIVKRRFVERYPFQKLFEIYHMHDGEQPAAAREDFLARLGMQLREDGGPDVAIVADYGHNLLDAEAVALLCEQARFLAVNAQLNAGNFGYNTIAKYPRADFLCISENELRLEMRRRDGDLRALVELASRQRQCPRLLITRGKQGCLCYGAEEGFFEIPAFTGKVVDRVGSGDTVLAVASLCVAQGAPMEVAGFLGNVAGAMAVGVVGNREPLDKVALVKHVIALLK